MRFFKVTALEISIVPQCLIVLLLGFCISTLRAEPHRPIQSSHDLDRQTQLVLQSMASGDLQSATVRAGELVDRFPRFRLGHLLHAELQASLGLQDVMASQHGVHTDKLIRLLLEAQSRLGQHTALPDNSWPSEIIQSGAHIQRLIVVDLSESVMYLYNTESEYPQLLKRHYISSGRGGYGKEVEGDLKTPLGIYAIQGFRSDASLPDLYGSGALMLDYPNTIDRLHGRTGYGIWLHGVPRRTMSRSPRSSEGCVTMGNDYLLQLSRQIDPQKTQVLLTHNLRWVKSAEQRSDQRHFQGLFRQYQQAWADPTLDKLLSVYQESALPPEINQLSTGSGASALTKLIDSEALARVNPATVGIFHYPKLDSDPAAHHTGTVLMSFELGHGAATIQVSLYWQQDSAGAWKIVTQSVEKTGI